jgi:exosortase/archaeosortase family protein
VDLTLPLSGRRQLSTYLLWFCLWIAGLALVFQWTRPLWVHAYMAPLTLVAETVLRGLGLQAAMGGPYVQEGLCTLAVSGVVYRVTFECTGLFALCMCIASILAFPTAPGARLRGLLFVVPAFAAYAALRIVVLGLVAHLSPAHIELFHLYVMVVANVGVVAALWFAWLRGIAGDVRR